LVVKQVDSFRISCNRTTPEVVPSILHLKSISSETIVLLYDQAYVFLKQVSKNRGKNYTLAE